MSNDSSHPLVSVVVGTKNEEENIEELLISIQKQTYKNLEIIIVDHEKTTDRTFDIAKKYTSKVYRYGTERSMQRNYGIEKANGIYVLILDADMKVSPEVIESCVEIMKNDEHTSGIVIKEISIGTGFWGECKKLEKELISNVPWIEAARFYPKSILVQLKGYDTSLISGEDWDLSQRAGQLGLIKRTDIPIYHKDIEPSFWKNIKKKYFYGKHIYKYSTKSVNNQNSNKQMSIVSRYKIYLRNPTVTFRNPFYGIGMLFIKTSEFIAIALGILYSKLNKSG